jgi:hypothetical protein
LGTLFLIFQKKLNIKDAKIIIVSNDRLVAWIVIHLNQVKGSIPWFQ